MTVKRPIDLPRGKHRRGLLGDDERLLTWRRVFSLAASVTLHGLVLLALAASEHYTPGFLRLASLPARDQDQDQDELHEALPGITVLPRPLEIPLLEPRPEPPVARAEDKPEPKPPEEKPKPPEEKPKPEESHGPRPQAPERGAPNVGRVQEGLKKEGPVHPPPAHKDEQDAAAKAKQPPPQRYQETPPAPPPSATESTAKAETEKPAKKPAAPEKKKAAKADPPPTGKGPGKAKPPDTSGTGAATAGDQVARTDDGGAKRAPSTKAQRATTARIGNDATDGEVMPTFVPAPYTRAELQDIVRFFQMKIIAYDPERQERKFFVEVDPDGKNMKRRVDFEAFAKTMGNRGLLVNHVMPDVVQQLVKEQDLPADRIVLNAMLSPGAARYLAQKEVQACKSAGLEPKDVATCHGGFRKSTSGSWIILIDRLVLPDGREVTVKDPELAQLQ